MHRKGKIAPSTVWTAAASAAMLTLACNRGPQNQRPEAAEQPSPAGVMPAQAGAREPTAEGTPAPESGAQAAETPKAVEPSGRTAEILQAIQGYQSWNRFSEYDDGAVHSEGHQSMYVVAYFNEAAAAGGFPEGSLLVKENRPEPDAPPAALTTMSKEADGWYWIKSTPDGKVMTKNGQPIAGDVDMCKGCHSAASGDDMVFSDGM